MGETAAMQQGLKLSKEVSILLSICLLDTLSSAYLFGNHMAVEANPLLRASADAGLLPFLSAKMLTFLPALLVAEWYGRANPAFVRPLLRCVSALYVGIYALAVGAHFLH